MIRHPSIIARRGDRCQPVLVHRRRSDEIVRRDVVELVGDPLELDGDLRERLELELGRALVQVVIIGGSLDLLNKLLGFHVLLLSWFFPAYDSDLAIRPSDLIDFDRFDPGHRVPDMDVSDLGISLEDPASPDQSDTGPTHG